MAKTYVINFMWNNDVCPSIGVSYFDLTILCITNSLCMAKILTYFNVTTQDLSLFNKPFNKHDFNLQSANHNLL